MAGPWEDYTTPVATPTPLPADGPWSDYGGQSAPTAPASSAEFKAGLHAILAAPDFTPDKAAAYIAQNHRSATGSTNDALKWVVQHPGHGGEVGIQDFGPQPAQQPNAAPQQPPQQQTMAVAPEGGFPAALRGGVEGYLPFANKVAGALDTVIPTRGDTETIWDGHSLTDAYQHNSAFETAQSQADASAHPLPYYAANIGGAIMSPIGKIGEGVAAANGLTGIARATTSGIIGGAAYGAAQGAGQPADTWGQFGQNVAGGTAAGTLMGGIGAPVAEGLVRGGAAVGGAAGRMLGRDEAAGAKIVALKLAQDHIDPQSAADLLHAGAANGTQTALADLGPNTRALAGHVSRQPGAARDIAVNFSRERQLGQGERIQDAIGRDLGPTTDTYAESQRIMQAAQQKAAPLYDKAYAAPPITTPELERVLATPAGKSATARAMTIAANEGRDPKALGFVIGKDGNVSLDPTLTMGEGADGMTLSQSPVRQRGFTPQSLDYVKRGLDDIIEQYRDPMTGKLRLDEAGRAINGVKNQLLNEVDRLNPDYKAARAAYAGPASLNDAMIDGRAALHKTPAQINQRLQNLSEPERQQYALGLRSAISDSLNKAGDYADKARKLIGTPEKRAVLQQVFGKDSDVGRFLDTIGQEGAGNETYATINSGSHTQRLASEDAYNSDENLLAAAGHVGHAIATGNPLRLLPLAAGNAFKFGVGNAAQRAREDAASMLFTTSPNDFLGALKKAETVNSANQLRLDNVVGGVRRGSANLSGYLGGKVNSLGLQSQTP